MPTQSGWWSRSLVIFCTEHTAPCLPCTASTCLNSPSSWPACTRSSLCLFSQVHFSGCECVHRLCTDKSSQLFCGTCLCHQVQDTGVYNYKVQETGLRRESYYIYFVANISSTPLPTLLCLPTLSSFNSKHCILD